jgi:hypothetical protein
VSAMSSTRISPMTTIDFNVASPALLRRQKWA